MREPGKGYWLLARRSIAQPEELAWYVCFGPAETTLEELVRVAGILGPLKSVLRRPRDRWGWTSMKCANNRHITLAMLAHAYLAVVRQQANAGCGGKKGESRSGMNP